MRCQPGDHLEPGRRAHRAHECPCRPRCSFAAGCGPFTPGLLAARCRRPAPRRASCRPRWSHREHPPRARVGRGAGDLLFGVRRAWVYRSRRVASGEACAFLSVEVKTELVSIEATLRKLDEKVRLGPTIVRDRFGWQPALVGRVLVLPEESTARRRVARHSAVLDQALPQRGRSLISWLRSPVGPLAAIWFASSTTGRDHKRRVVTRSVMRRGETGQSDA